MLRYVYALCAAQWDQEREEFRMTLAEIIEQFFGWLCSFMRALVDVLRDFLGFWEAGE